MTHACTHSCVYLDFIQAICWSLHGTCACVFSKLDKRLSHASHNYSQRCMYMSNSHVLSTTKGVTLACVFYELLSVNMYVSNWMLVKMFNAWNAKGVHSTGAHTTSHAKIWNSSQASTKHGNKCSWVYNHVIRAETSMYYAITFDMGCTVHT